MDAIVSLGNQRKLRSFIMTIACWLGFYFFIPSHALARHKCPKPPTKGGVFGMFLTTTYLPVASAMASTRSSNTSGCRRGHPSDKFYQPKEKRIGQYLEETLELVKEESAQGYGPHLEALALLSGCSPQGMKPLMQHLQQNYSQLFLINSNYSYEEQTKHVALEIVQLLYKNRILDQECNDDLDSSILLSSNHKSPSEPLDVSIIID